MTATSSPAEPPESTLAAVVAEHVEFEWHEDADRGFWRCHCGVELNHAEPDWDASDLDAGHLHSAHVAAAILAATPTAARVAELEAALAAAEARLRAVEAADPLLAVAGVDPKRYHEGDVNHVLQPVIGWLRLALADGTPITAERVGSVIDRLRLACESERQWLTSPQPAP